MCWCAVAIHPPADGIAVNVDLGADVLHRPAMCDALFVEPLGIRLARARVLPQRNAVALGRTLHPGQGRIKPPRDGAERPSLFHVQLVQFVSGEPHAEFIPTVGTPRAWLRDWRVLNSERVFGQQVLDGQATDAQLRGNGRDCARRARGAAVQFGDVDQAGVDAWPSNTC